MPATRHIAIVTDPVTGKPTILTARSAAELEQLVDEHLDREYPQPTHTPQDFVPQPGEIVRRCV